MECVKDFLVNRYNTAVNCRYIQIYSMKLFLYYISKSSVFRHWPSKLVNFGITKGRRRKSIDVWEYMFIGIIIESDVWSSFDLFLQNTNNLVHLEMNLFFRAILKKVRHLVWQGIYRQRWKTSWMLCNPRRCWDILRHLGSLIYFVRPFCTIKNVSIFS